METTDTVIAVFPELQAAEAAVEAERTAPPADHPSMSARSRAGHAIRGTKVKRGPNMLHSDLRYPGWVQGWGVVEGNPSGWKFAGVFATLQEARTAAAHAGPGYEVRWGSYDQRDKGSGGGNSC